MSSALVDNLDNHPLNPQLHTLLYTLTVSMAQRLSVRRPGPDWHWMIGCTPVPSRRNAPIGIQPPSSPQVSCDMAMPMVGRIPCTMCAAIPITCWHSRVFLIHPRTLLAQTNNHCGPILQALGLLSCCWPCCWQKRGKYQGAEEKVLLLPPSV